MKSKPFTVTTSRLITPAIAFDTLPSTNAEALRRAVAGAMMPLWIVAERQTGGRGRSGRTWVSEAGNLYATLLVPLMCGPKEAVQLSLVAGVGVAQAIVESAWDFRAADETHRDSWARKVRLKWPNDLLIAGDKAGGILVETTTVPPRAGLCAAIGIGINLAHHPLDIGRPATHLAAHGIALTPDTLLLALDRTLRGWLTHWNNGRGFEAVRAAWLAAGTREGTPLSVTVGTVRTHGVFAGLDADGALLLADADGGSLKFTYGDVTLPTPT